MFLSLIIPVYNTPNDKLTRLLNSIKSNADNDYEIIIVDDSSTNDDTKKFLKENKRIYNYQLINNKKNIGLGPTRNVGLKHAKGKYIWFIDSDDYISNNSIETIKKRGLNDFDFISINYIAFNKKNKFYKSEHDFVYKNIVIYGMATVWSKIISKDFMIKNNIFFIDTNKPHEDEYFNLLLLSKARKLTKIEDVLYYYDKTNNNSLSSNKNIYYKYISILFYVNAFLEQNIGFSAMLKKYSIKFLLIPFDFLINFKISYIKFLESKSFYEKLLSKITNKKINLKYLPLTKIMYYYIKLRCFSN